MAAKGARDWAQLDAYETEYAERLADENKPGQAQNSQFLAYLRKSARQRDVSYDLFYADELKGHDEPTRRLFALQNKIHVLRRKLGLPDEEPLETEKPYLPAVPAAKKADDKRPRFLADPAPEGSFYPVTFDEIRAVLAELPPEHAHTVYEIHLTSQKKGSIGGDWLGGSIRLHCLVAHGKPDDMENPTIRRPMGKREHRGDMERWGGHLEWEGNKLFAIWPLDAYKTFVLRRVLVHEIAHGVAELPGFAAKVKQAGSVEKFCEQYAEAFFRPPGRSVRLGF